MFECEQEASECEQNMSECEQKEVAFKKYYTDF